MRSLMGQPDNKRVVTFLGNDMADDAAGVAGGYEISETIFRGLTAAATCCARRCTIRGGVNSTSNGRAAFNLDPPHASKALFLQMNFPDRLLESLYPCATKFSTMPAMGVNVEMYCEDHSPTR
jgi:hypothetical protein